MINDDNKTTERPAYLRDLLREPPELFKGFHHEDLLDFLSIGIKEDYLKEDVIVDKDDYINSAYLVCNGEVSVWEDGIELTQLGEKSFLGETFLFSDSNRMAKIVAVRDSTLLRFQRHDMLLFFKQKPSKLFNIFTRNIIYVQQQKMNHMNNLLIGVKKKLLNYTDEI